MERAVDTNAEPRLGHLGDDAAPALADVPHLEPAPRPNRWIEAKSARNHSCRGSGRMSQPSESAARRVHARLYRHSYKTLDERHLLVAGHTVQTGDGGGEHVARLSGPTPRAAG